MLKSLRKNARYFYVLFVLVILSFVLWVPGMNQDDRQSGGSVLATIGDEEISVDEFWKRFGQLEDVYKQTYPDSYDDKMQAQLKRDVLVVLVEGRILMAAARASGIIVSDKELNEDIVTDPTFMRDGVFSSEIYKNALRINRFTPARYESLKRNELLVKKMRSVYENAIDLAPSELAGVPEDNELRASLEEMLINEKKRAAVLSFVGGYRKNVKVEINENLVL
jgi:peptidyl-prolyl cis-trans isomerase D